MRVTLMTSIIPEFRGREKKAFLDLIANPFRDFLLNFATQHTIENCNMKMLLSNKLCTPLCVIARDGSTVHVIDCHSLPPVFLRLLLPL